MNREWDVGLNAADADMYSLEDVIVGAGHFTQPYGCFPFARPQRAADGQLGGLTCPAQD